MLLYTSQFIVDWICSSSTSDRYSIEEKSGEFGGQDNTSNSLSCSSNHYRTICAVLQGALSCCNRLLLSGNTVDMKRRTWSATMFRSVACVKLTSTCPDSGFPNRTLPRASHSLHRLAFFPQCILVLSLLQLNVEYLPVRTHYVK